MKNTEEKKLTETITFRTSTEQKVKLTQKAVDKGISLSNYIEELVTENDELLEKGINPILKDQDSIGKLYQIIDKLLDKNTLLQEQVDNLNKQIKTPPNKLAAHIEKLELKENKKETIMDKIITSVPENKKDEFIERYGKMLKYRTSKGKDKNEGDMVYSCVKYCMNTAAYFDKGPK